MLSYTRARTDDVRALAGAIALGSGAGLLIGAACLVGAGAHAPVRPAPASAISNRPVAAALPAAQPGSTQGVDKTVSNAGAQTLRDRFRLAGVLTQGLARPFQFRQVADARSDVNCLAEAVYFEARGEAADGQKAVAQVVLNRVRHPAFPKTICGVVHQHGAGGCQFSFACESRAADVDSLAWRRAEGVASAALHGAVMSAVGDATHFQTAHSGPFAGLLRVAQVGAHVFYRFAGRGGAPAMFHQTPAPSASAGTVQLARLDVATGAISFAAPGRAATSAEPRPDKAPTPPLVASAKPDAPLADPKTVPAPSLTASSRVVSVTQPADAAAKAQPTITPVALTQS